MFNDLLTHLQLLLFYYVLLICHVGCQETFFNLLYKEFGKIILSPSYNAVLLKSHSFLSAPTLKPYLSTLFPPSAVSTTHTHRFNTAVGPHQMFEDNELSKDQLSPETADAVLSCRATHKTRCICRCTHTHTHSEQAMHTNNKEKKMWVKMHTKSRSETANLKREVDLHLDGRFC